MGRCWCWNKDTGEDFTAENIDWDECGVLEKELRSGGYDWVCYYRSSTSRRGWG